MKKKDWEKEYVILNVQFDLINEENERLKEENDLLKEQVKDLTDANAKLRRIVSHTEEWIRKHGIGEEVRAWDIGI